MRKKHLSVYTTVIGVLLFIIAVVGVPDEYSFLVFISFTGGLLAGHGPHLFFKK